LNKPPFKVGENMFALLAINKSMPNVINKKFDESDTKLLDNIVLKESTDVLHPVFTFKNDSVPKYNYCYIPDFNRYYYVEITNTFPKGMYTASCSVDVLNSYSNQILSAKTKTFITKSDAYNKYVDDGYLSEVRKEVEVYTGTTGFTDIQNTILVTVGGV
jgi:hypothetical protein